MAFGERSPLAAFNQGVGRFAAGNPSVSYDDQGRIQYDTAPPVQLPSRTSNFFWRSSDAPNQNIRTRWSFLPWNRGVEAVKTGPTPLVTRTRFDNYNVLPGLGFREYVRPEPVRQQTMVTEGRMAMPPSVRDQLVVEEMKIYNLHPPWWWLFIVIGILLVVLGIINILLCVDMHMYCRFWSGVPLIIIGIIGAIHQGDYYRQTCKSYLYIIFGMLTACTVYACLSFALDTFCHQLIEIAQFNDKDAYIEEMKFRYSYLGIQPRFVLNNDVAVNIWVCFALDGLTVLLLTLAFLVVTSVIFVIDRFYNSNWVITRKVEPFCAPNIFNPWGQVSLGQAQIFIGMVLNASVHGNEVRLWQRTYAPVWAGIIPIVAGVFAALSLKSCGLRHRCWNLMAILLQFFSALISIIAIIFVIIGMIENIRTLSQSTVMNYTDFAQRMMMASVFLFCISAIICLINVFYSIALFIRLLFCHCCNHDERGHMPVQYIYDEYPGQTTRLNDEKKNYGGVWARDPRENYAVESFETPYRVGADTRMRPYVVD